MGAWPFYIPIASQGHKMVAGEPTLLQAGQVQEEREGKGTKGTPLLNKPLWRLAFLASLESLALPPSKPQEGLGMSEDDVCH